MNFKKEQIIKEIEEAIQNNRFARQAYCNETYKEASRRSNDVLSKAKNYINSSEEYERGLEDAWELAKVLTGYINRGIFTTPHTYEMFGCDIPEIFDKYTAHDAISIYNDWLEEEKKKEEEAARKPVLGDIVEIVSINGINQATSVRGVYIKDTGRRHNIVTNNGDVYTFDKEVVRSIEKTGEHVDILGALGK